MDSNNLLNNLINMVNNANRLKVEYGVTGQRIDDEDKNKLITYSSNTMMKVDYIKKTGEIENIKSDFSGTFTKKESFFNNKKVSSDSGEDIEFSSEEYEKLFKPGGILYPLSLQQLIPIDSQMNNKYCQICIPSKELIAEISGHIKSTYAIYQKEEDLYDITMIMSQLDNETQIHLMQYCNIKIYILE